jgi:5'-nucleotidase
MKNPLLYIDLDGVCADFDEVILRYDPKVDLKLVTNHNSNLFRDEVDNICESNPHIFLEILPIPGAIASVLSLKDMYEIYFLSTPMWNVPESFGDKRIWIEKYFGEFAHKRLILTHRKDLALGDFLIDDRLTNGSESFQGVHIHYGQKPFEDWNKVTQYLKNYASIKKITTSVY